MKRNALLVYDARRLTTGANVHKITGLIRMYEAAAAEDDPASRNAAKGMERALARYVKKLRGERARTGIT